MSVVPTPGVEGLSFLHCVAIAPLTVFSGPASGLSIPFHCTVGFFALQKVRYSFLPLSLCIYYFLLLEHLFSPYLSISSILRSQLKRHSLKKVFPGAGGVGAS